MSDNMDEILSQAALRNAVLHSAAHPQKNVSGVLVGSESIESSIPLFHSAPTSALLEVALDLITDSYQILGFYESRFLPPKMALVPSQLIENLCGAARSKFKQPTYALCLTTDWSAEVVAILYKFTSQSYEKVYEVHKDQSMPAQEFLLKNPPIFDFDDHFFNPSNDWRNLHLLNY